ncbi:MAG: hypothetical protein HY909_29855 [Deltaproteobacteria bacterium]|nr:hypothetical protein [Deltaproteobacteria bacterium]
MIPARAMASNTNARAPRSTVVVALGVTVAGATTVVTLRGIETGRVYFSRGARTEEGLVRATLRAERTCVERGFVLVSPPAAQETDPGET